MSDVVYEMHQTLWCHAVSFLEAETFLGRGHQNPPLIQTVFHTYTHTHTMDLYISVHLHYILKQLQVHGDYRKYLFQLVAICNFSTSWY